jgi:ferredoxin
MNWGSCSSSCASNNIHSDYPALMSDGRLYTSYEPSCRKNESYIERNGVQTNYQYRQFLMDNAMSIMQENRREACNECGVCNYGYPLRAAEPAQGKYLYRSAQDMSQPYGYENSDLKNVYLSRHALQSRVVAPLMSQQGYLSLPRHK